MRYLRSLNLLMIFLASFAFFTAASQDGDIELGLEEGDMSRLQGISQSIFFLELFV